jgi:hypothetical protein
VKAPEGKGDQVAQVAFKVGVSQVTIHQEQIHRPREPEQTKDVIDIETATPIAKAFIDEMVAAPFFDPRHYSIAVRQARSIITKEKASKITWPIVEPASDIYEELWQFSHVTFSFIVQTHERFCVRPILWNHGRYEASNVRLIFDY